MSQVTQSTSEHSPGGNRVALLLTVWGFIGAAIIGIHLYQASVEGLDIGIVAGLVGGIGISGLVLRDLLSDERPALSLAATSDLTYVITLFVLSMILYVIYVMATQGV